MQTVDFSGMIVMYNFVIGVLLMASSERISVYAGRVSTAYRDQISRYTRISTFSFGACVAIVSAAIYIPVHILRIGV